MRKGILGALAIAGVFFLFGAAPANAAYDKFVVTAEELPGYNDTYQEIGYPDGGNYNVFVRSNIPTSTEISLAYDWNYDVYGPGDTYLYSDDDPILSNSFDIEANGNYHTQIYIEPMPAEVLCPDACNAGGETDYYTDYSDWTFIDMSYDGGADVRPGTITLTLSSVPEPVAWWTIIAGFGLIGGLTRRRRSAVIS